MKHPVKLIAVFLLVTLTASAVTTDRVSARPELVITTFGFGSCARENRPQPIWDTINAARCDAIVLCGDNIDGDSAEPSVLREDYALFAPMPGFARPLRCSPPGTITTTAPTTQGPVPWHGGGAKAVL